MTILYVIGQDFATLAIEYLLILNRLILLGARPDISCDDCKDSNFLFVVGRECIDNSLPGAPYDKTDFISCAFCAISKK